MVIPELDTWIWLTVAPFILTVPDCELTSVNSFRS